MSTEREGQSIVPLVAEAKIDFKEWVRGVKERRMMLNRVNLLCLAVRHKQRH
jgi:hypothetical protein